MSRNLIYLNTEYLAYLRRYLTYLSWYLAYLSWYLV